MLTGLLDIVRAQDAFRAILETPESQALGLPRSARPYVIAALAGQGEAAITLVVTARVERAHDLAEQLPAWDPTLRVLSFPEPNPIFYERAPWGPRTIRARLQVLARLLDQPASRTVVVTSARALTQRTLPPDIFAAHTQSLQVGDRIRPDELLRDWLAAGYEPGTLVTQPGTFSRRGGIVDVFPVASDFPIRVEFFGDDIESLRVFDPATQRSADRLGEINVTPAREALPHLAPPLAENLTDWFAAQRAAVAHESDLDDPILPLADQSSLEGGTAFPALEFYLPYLYPNSASLLDYLPPNARLLVEDTDELRDTIEELEAQSLRLVDDLMGTDPSALPPDYPLPYVTWDHIAERLSGQAHSLELGGLLTEGKRGLGSFFGSGQRFGGQLKSLFDFLKRASNQNESVLVISRQAERLAELWSEESWPAVSQTVEHLDLPPSPGMPTFISSALSEGWTLRADNGITTHLLTDAEIFGWQRPEPRRRRRPRAIAPEDYFADLSPGDFVVHSEYGIGHFQGLEKRVLAGVEREYLLVAYDGANSLYVPIHQADRLTRYVGVDDRPPPLSQLGKAEWTRVRERTRESVMETAREMLELYAARAAVPGHAFGPDTPWQHELEASFSYVETEDQLLALREVKADMETPRPMDRLICGDVGYGKTEVALRAAFKAVTGGKQVAMLVPTTVLAQQHYETFSRRLAPFPIVVEMLSRFRTRSEQADILNSLRGGTVDIVVGTHRLLQNDVELKNLGLLIVDEEQRFGVTHKEQLKRLRTEVDVLTLTATPIPRTLYMALTGVRDISNIDTPPEERLPVVTHVGKRDDDLTRRAILREMDRGGQTFYVHNRVQTILTERERLTRLAPEARIEVGHGQMPEAHLSEVMQRFARGEVDVLVSTSIIESGLDIPNANTLIVDRADRFGLSQLYQLRGRVGRSATRAYAYFFHPPFGRLTHDARARLETMAEQTELGAGFSIAMRDLELRGAGDILGYRQHGHIVAVGFHLYTRMLNQAVRALRAQREDAVPDALPPPETATLTIDLPLPIFLPTDYVSDVTLRLKLYRRLADLTSTESIAEMAAELTDRFGTLPPPVENLLYQLRVKSLALPVGVEAITSDGRVISIRMPGLESVDRLALQHSLRHGVRVSRTSLYLPLDGGANIWQPALIAILENLNHHHQQQL
jgi:transcription-repair coupling factor (superfamily II helicase)